MEYYGPDYKLFVQPSNMDNLNTASYLDKIRCQLLENLRNIPCAPSVQMHEAPRPFEVDNEVDDADPDVRMSRAFFLPTAAQLADRFPP